ncbi:MAG: hypothetical protein AMXMBFR48_16850 [Ignavibacteriales bacterium]
MFGYFKSDEDELEMGGEIHQDRKRRERTAMTVFGILALVLINVILYFLSNQDL